MSEQSQPVTNLDEIAELFRSLAQETRLRLLCLLKTGEHSVGEIDALLAIGQPGLSQQLAVLRAAGLVNTRRVAKQVYYSLNPEAFTQVATLLATLSHSTSKAAPPEQPKPRRPAAANFARQG
jgi:DNA-binding transcriptional ArsR family regulator